jgi:hypothetical protein
VTAQAQRRFEWLWRIGALFLLLALGWLTTQADGRYVLRESYDRDQQRIERQLDTISQDIKTLLRGQ